MEGGEQKVRIILTRSVCIDSLFPSFSSLMMRVSLSFCHKKDSFPTAISSAFKKKKEGRGVFLKSAVFHEPLTQSS